MNANRKRLTKEERLQIYNKYNGHCAYCGKPIEYKDMQVDHIKPLFHNWSNEEKERILPKGYFGDDSIENMNPSCRSCNFYKSTLTLESFRNDIGQITSRLNKLFIYRLAKAYGLINETNNEVKFYYENFQN